jgi:hypothetical protein
MWLTNHFVLFLLKEIIESNEKKSSYFPLVNNNICQSVYWQMIIACRDRLNFLLLIASWPCNITKWRKNPRRKIRKWFYYAIISFPSSLESYERSFLIEFIVKLLINSLLEFDILSFMIIERYFLRELNN